VAHHSFSDVSMSVDAINFEITDFAEARRALEEVPSGLNEVAALSPDYWKHRRRPQQPQDRALAGTTIDWFLELPSELRPRELCERYPRVANMVADAWSNAEVRVSVLNNLLVDARGRRNGFPRCVRLEIEALQRSTFTTDGSGTD
jgi:hypothetical protein